MGSVPLLDLQDSVGIKKQNIVFSKNVEQVKKGLKKRFLEVK